MSQETFIADVRQFTEAVGCTADRFNVRQTALYVGLQLEEMAEKLDAMGMGGDARNNPVKILHVLSGEFKRGLLDGYVEGADREAMLDADVDLAWVTIGSALSQGADVLGAMREVSRANLDKLVECVDCAGFMAPADDCTKCNGSGLVAIKDANGKVTKPAGWRAPDITPFVCKDGAA